MFLAKEFTCKPQDILGWSVNDVYNHLRFNKESNDLDYYLKDRQNLMSSTSRSPEETQMLNTANKFKASQVKT